MRGIPPPPPLPPGEGMEFSWFESRFRKEALLLERQKLCTINRYISRWCEIKAWVSRQRNRGYSKFSQKLHPRFDHCSWSLTSPPVSLLARFLDSSVAEYRRSSFFNTSRSAGQDIERVCRPANEQQEKKRTRRKTRKRDEKLASAKRDRERKRGERAEYGDVEREITKLYTREK